MDREAIVRSQLEPIYPHIRAIFRAAEGWWQRMPEEIRGILRLDKRTHANVTWQFLVHEAKTVFAGTHVTAKASVNTITFSCANKVLMRFKKLSSQGISSNYPTQRSLDFNLQMVLPGMPEAIRVDVGYVMDPATFAFAELRVVERAGNTAAWQFPIPDGDEGSSGGSITPIGTVPVDAGSRTRVVVPQQQPGKAADGIGA
jgi:hypothetical protein